MPKFLNITVSASIGLKSHFFVFILLITFYNLSFSNTETKNDSALDSIAVIESGLNHIFKINHFAPELYANPVQIIKSGNVPKETRFIINGRAIELVDRQTTSFYTKMCLNCYRL